MKTLIRSCLAFAAVLFSVPPALRAVEFNAAGVSPSGNKTFLVDAAISTRHLLVKFGSDAVHVAVCGASNVPLGVCTDEPEAAEDATNVSLLGAAQGTRLMVASEALSAGDKLYTAAGGKVQNLPGSAGTYYLVGVALTAAAADGDELEVLPCFPVAAVVS